MNYHHLTIEERSCIRKYYVDGLSYREIARLIGRNVSTVSREIRRNCTHMYDIPTYYPHTAQKKYLLRRSYCHRGMFHSQEVIDYINEKYNGSVVSVVENPTDGYDASIDYSALNGETVSIAATPAPHAEILEIVKNILAEKGITLKIQVVNDYVTPNTFVEDGSIDANYFQHLPYLEDFNAQQGTHLVPVAGIHVEPMGLYGGKQTTLDAVSGK